MTPDPKDPLLELDDPANASDEGAAVASGTQPTQQARPTVVPAFDPQAFAEEAIHRDQAPTITNEVELEQARLASMSTSDPPMRGRAESFVHVEASEEDFEELDASAQEALLSARLGPLDGVPSLVKQGAELAAQLEDPKSAFVAGLVDGLLPLETILEVAGLPAAETLRILDRLVTVGVVVIRPGPA